MGCKFVPKRLLGRLRNGAESDSGHIAHAVCHSERSSAKALCGARPGPKSVGWGTYDEEEVTCPKCLERLSNPPVFTIEKQISSVGEVESADYKLFQNGEYCGYWCIRSNHPDYEGRPFSWKIHFIDEFRGCFCFLNCSRAEYLIREVASGWEKERIHVKQSRLNEDSRCLFRRLAGEGIVIIVE